MKNISLIVVDNQLIIKIDLNQEQGSSRSGKTTIIATTAGNVAIPEHPDIKLGLNPYRK